MTRLPPAASGGGWVLGDGISGGYALCTWLSKLHTQVSFQKGGNWGVLETWKNPPRIVLAKRTGYWRTPFLTCESQPPGSRVQHARVHAWHLSLRCKAGQNLTQPRLAIACMAITPPCKCIVALVAHLTKGEPNLPNQQSKAKRSKAKQSKQTKKETKKQSNSNASAQAHKARTRRTRTNMRQNRGTSLYHSPHSPSFSLSSLPFYVRILEKFLSHRQDRERCLRDEPLLQKGSKS